MKREFLKGILDFKNHWARIWFWIGMEEKKLDWNLDKDSVVFEIGAYKGSNMAKLQEKYGCNIYAFEPVKEFYDIAKKKIDNPKTRLFNFGLSHETKTFPFYLDKNSSSVFPKDSLDKDGAIRQDCKLVDITEFMDKHGIKDVDLMIIDMEGQEYDFAKKLINSGYLIKIREFMIQFHRVVSDYSRKRKVLRNLFKKTHKQIYCYPFVWEVWERKDESS